MRILGLSLAIAVLHVAVAVADSNGRHNCSTSATCSSLRHRLPNENEKFNAKLVKTSNSSLNFDLTNKRGDRLVLTLTGVVRQRFRIEIEEPDRHRYRLQYSLEKEPTSKGIKVVESTNGSVIAEDGEGNKVVVKTTPLFIEFYHNNVLETVFEGNRIIFENTAESQAFAFSVRFQDANRLMGLHEHADYLKLRHTTDFHVDPYRLKNTDYGVFGYDLGSTKSMYGSIPVIYGFGNVTSGIFHHNAAEQWIDINLDRNSAYFMVDGGRLDLFVLLGPSLTETVRQYVDLTGKPHLPQLWALGYHQCRWAYNTTEDVMDIIGNFDKYNFPLDVLWLDIEYTSNRQWFTWNKTAFADPIKLLNWVDAQGHRKLVPISDPHIKTDFNYKIYADLFKGGMFVNNSDGLNPFVGECWPGNSSWVDFFNPKAVDYYAKLHLYENFPSTPALGGFWNDMNEPTLFDNDERTLPWNTLHYGGVRHRDVHNIYGMLQTMSTHKGLMARDNGTLRPFILSRAYFAGSQRYASKWSGDNWGEFEDLRFSVPMALTSNLVGLAFYGADIPGFFGTATEELLIRWYQIGAWLPFFRAHAAEGSPRREPFRFGNITQANLRTHMQLRYKHLPYWYTLFYEHTITGDPIVRPLLYQYPDDPVGYDSDDELLIGNDILVASVYKSNATSVPVYFPGKGKDLWVQITGNSSKYYQGGTQANIPVDITFIPIFYRAGGIVTRKPNVKRSTADIKDAPFDLHIVLDKSGQATTRLYIDDYESFNYVNNKEFIYVNVVYTDSNNTLAFSTIDGKPGDLKINVGSAVIYKLIGTTFTVTKHEVDRDGNQLKTINVLKNQIQL